MLYHRTRTGHAPTRLLYCWRSALDRHSRSVSTSPYRVYQTSQWLALLQTDDATFCNSVGMVLRDLPVHVLSWMACALKDISRSVRIDQLISYCKNGENAGPSPVVVPFAPHDKRHILVASGSPNKVLCCSSHMEVLLIAWGCSMARAMLRDRGMRLPSKVVQAVLSQCFRENILPLLNHMLYACECTPPVSDEIRLYIHEVEYWYIVHSIVFAVTLNLFSHDSPPSIRRQSVTNVSLSEDLALTSLVAFSEMNRSIHNFSERMEGDGFFFTIKRDDAARQGATVISRTWTAYEAERRRYALNGNPSAFGLPPPLSLRVSRAPISSACLRTYDDNTRCQYSPCMGFPPPSNSLSVCGNNAEEEKWVEEVNERLTAIALSGGKPC